MNIQSWWLLGVTLWAAAILTTTSKRSAEQALLILTTTCLTIATWQSVTT